MFAPPTAASVQEHLFADEHLEWLNLSGNPLTDDGATHIAEMLRYNTKLHTLGMARCGLGEGICKLLDTTLEVNSSLTELDFAENNVSAMRERYVNDSCKANRQLLECRDYPKKYDYAAQRSITRKHLLKKIHHLEKPKLRQLLANNSFVNDKLMHRRLLELVPPDRHKLVFRCVQWVMSYLTDGMAGFCHWQHDDKRRNFRHDGYTGGFSVLSICLSVSQSCTSLEHKVPFAPSYALQIAHAHPRTTINRKPLLYDVRRSNPPPHVHGMELVGQFWGWMGCTWVGSSCRWASHQCIPEQQQESTESAHG